MSEKLWFHVCSKASKVLGYLKLFGCPWYHIPVLYTHKKMSVHQMIVYYQGGVMAGELEIQYFSLWIVGYINNNIIIVIDRNVRNKDNFYISERTG